MPRAPVTDADQPDDRGEAVLVVERDDAELEAGHEFAALRLGRAPEPVAERGIEPVELAHEELADEVVSGLERKEALANEALLFRRQRDPRRERAIGKPGEADMRRGRHLRETPEACFACEHDGGAVSERLRLARMEGGVRRRPQLLLNRVAPLSMPIAALLLPSRNNAGSDYVASEAISPWKARAALSIREIPMLDLVMLGLGLGLFALSLVYAFPCDRL